jgi:nitrate reductase gamma subunit
MMVFLLPFLYAAALVSVAGCVVRAIRYARAPLHLRWEVYPVPRGRAGEFAVMAPEILFLKGLWEFNRALWWRSYPFHLGLYLLIATGLLLCAGGALHGLYAFTGASGAGLVLVGGAALLVHRLRDPKLKPYTTGGDIFNLAFFLATVGILTAGFVLRGPADPGAAAFVRALLTFDTAARVPALLAAGSVLAALLAAYIPMTHMSHFIAKYFTYHAVRWDEKPNCASIQKRMAEYLTYRPTWAAKHVGADGTKSWAEIATSRPVTGAKI